MNSSQGPVGGKPSFLDRGTLIAFAIILIFWMIWSRYMESQQPPVPTEVQVAQTPPSGTPSINSNEAAPTAAASAPLSGLNEDKKEENFVSFSDNVWSFSISSKGMGLKQIDIKGYQTRENKPILLGQVEGNYPFSTRLNGTEVPIDFTIEKVAEDTFVGRANVNGFEIEKTMKVNSATYSIETVVKAKGVNSTAFTGVSTVVNDVLRPKPQGSLLSGRTDHQDLFINHDGKKTRHIIDSDSGYDFHENNVKVAALGEHYFALAVVDRSDLLPSLQAKVAPGGQQALTILNYKPINPSDEFIVKFVGFAGPKSFDLLSRIDEQLAEVIDYGMFAFLGKPMLWLLKYLFSIMGNWGWAIVILTIIVRFLVLPFNLYSFKSMKMMQKIQPEMNRIREKYKDKPADQRLQMNQEIMELMKRNKANPLGGCIPMLLQIPVFIALWQVLGQSIELYRAPFMLWFHDLSVMDPYYVLPVLMGITMFIQQKITPTTMDPQQAKIMMFMPVVFSVFMISLPSGLTLYMFVSALFGIIQQYIFMREKTSTSAKPAKEAKA